MASPAKQILLALADQNIERSSAKLSETGEIGEDAPNEANLGESISGVEPQDSIQVTANPGALPGLDNGGGAARGRPHAGTRLVSGTAAPPVTLRSSGWLTGSP